MATPGELVRTVSEALRIDEVTVTWFYRRLREAGLMTRGGRGRSAPKMAASDAANLLLACLSGSSGSDVADAVTALRASVHADEPLDGLDLPLECYKSLPWKHTLGEALDAIFAELASKVGQVQLQLTVSRWFGGYRASIELWTEETADDIEQSIDYVYFRPGFLTDWNIHQEARQKYGGRSITERVYSDVIARIVECIAPRTRD